MEEASAELSTRRLRETLPISLRLMLLVLALAAVFFAWIGACRERQRVETRGRIQELQLMRQFAVKRLDSHPEEAATWRKSIWEIDDELKVKRGP
jgi:hypothetical protein